MNPITPEALPALYSKVVWLSFALAFVFGAVAQRTNFCTMGAIADAMSFGDRTRLRVSAGSPTPSAARCSASAWCSRAVAAAARWCDWAAAA
jgi:hypothetical protein